MYVCISLCVYIYIYIYIYIYTHTQCIYILYYLLLYYILFFHCNNRFSLKWVLNFKTMIKVQRFKFLNFWILFLVIQKQSKNLYCKLHRILPDFKILKPFDPTKNRKSNMTPHVTIMMSTLNLSDVALFAFCFM